MNYSTGASQLPNDQFLRWGQNPQMNGGSGYPDPTGSFSPNLYNNGMAQPQEKPTQTSNQLARSPANQQLVTRAGFSSANNEAWPEFGEDIAQQPADEAWLNDDEELERKALIAKREAQAKRKPIPPFVQKLSSFLDEPKNKDMIRWSDAGDSFIVLDEDEFAKTLIPELYKHNNYASFVRQLNMYGFHKKVGLSDNSMRSSEKKHKSPSEYYNPYFKRGRPNLLWLIQKPKTPQGKGSGKGGIKIKQEDRDGNADEEGDDAYEVESPAPPNQGYLEQNQNVRNGRHHLMIGQGGGLPQDELSAVHQELQQVRQQQQVISNAIAKIKREHEQLYGQAAAFQNWHDRHENSINAILTFLATIYNKSLEGNGAQNFASMFAGALPNDTKPSGNVVDVGDYGDQDAGSNTSHGQMQQRYRRQPLLLKAPPQNGQIQSASPSPAASTDSPRQRPQTSAYAAAPQLTTNCYANQSVSPAQSGAVQELFDQDVFNGSSESPRVSTNSEGQIPERDIMALINSANANNTNFPSTHMDFPTALTHLETADGSSPLTQNQRNDVLRLIANGSANENSPSTHNNINNNNALTSPNPPPMPNLSDLPFSRSELNVIYKTQKDQNSKITQLTNLLQPLSPSGSIPGIGPDTHAYNASDPLDLDQIFNSGDYFADAPNGGAAAEAAEFDFGPDPDDCLRDFELFDDPMGVGEAGAGFAADGTGGLGGAGAGADALGGTVESLASKALFALIKKYAQRVRKKAQIVPQPAAGRPGIEENLGNVK
ncbi:Winged helix-turn-helix DNA-binding domain [Lasallia pustulata]|uniref:Winged helix-turn-helix DNA-binding domain n=1 Tax=Lasallia pustulata TaxID=136370 RepID=A0A1W5D918_9LECA|nr:Winged helix-turn-helix DNA-binding domain [Lasallia pustulata]